MVSTAFLGFLLAASAPSAEARDFKAWLEEDVRWIISGAEKKRFESLKSDEERSRFVEQFWKDRDPTPSTPENEYQEEYYRRLKTVDELFQEGTLTGRNTDRGRVYLIHGPPSSRTSEADSEIWSYPSNPYARYYRGSLVLLFRRGGNLFQQRVLSESREAQRRLDRYQAGTRDFKEVIATPATYRLVAAGPGLGLGDVGQIRTSAGETDRYIGDVLRSPGEVLEERKKEIARRREALEQAETRVAAEVSFQDLPLRLSTFPIRRDENALLFVTVGVPTSDLAFREEESGAEAAKIDALCQVFEAGTDRRIDAFEDTLSVARPEKPSRVEYDNRFQLPPGGYDLSCILRDAASERIGFERASVEIARPQPGKLAMSPLLLTQRVQAAAEEDALRFQDLRFIPGSGLEMIRELPLYLYFEVYNLTVDGRPRELYFDYRVYDQEKTHLQTNMSRFEPPQTEGSRGVLALMFDISKLPPGEYSLLLKVLDPKAKDYAIRRAGFSIPAP